MIKNIIFDLGNVLINYDFEIFFEKLGYQRYERTLQEAHKEIFDFECGKMSITDFISALQKVYTSDLDTEQFTEAWCDVFWANDELLDIVPDLQKNYRLMILSNNDELHFPYIWERYRSLHIFSQKDIMITSRLGYIKPDIRVYQEAMLQHDFSWYESLFIDDVKVNTDIAASLGAAIIWHQDNAATLAKLNKYLNPVVN
ncbi:MAG: HAD-IA family hydrolase [Candidatus Cloacimonetes bacterium]|nr:HAD-IA family hydrolase [Candidatus Cloacimonadota bacterium]